MSQFKNRWNYCLSCPVSRTKHNNQHVFGGLKKLSVLFLYSRLNISKQVGLLAEIGNRHLVVYCFARALTNNSIFCPGGPIRILIVEQPLIKLLPARLRLFLCPFHFAYLFQAKRRVYKTTSE